MNELISAEDVLDKDILELIGATGLTSEEKDDLYSRMIHSINFRVIERIENELASADKIAAWKTKVESENIEDLKKFYLENNIDIEALTADESLKYKVEVVTYLTIAEKTGKTLDEVYKKLENNPKEDDAGRG